MKKQHLLKTMLLLCALVVGSSSLWATDYKSVLSFDCATTSSNGTTEKYGGKTTSLSTTYAGKFLSDACGNVASITVSTTPTKTYWAKGTGGATGCPDDCLKVGGGSNAGSVEFTIPDTYDKIERVVITGYEWKDDTKVGVNGSKKVDGEGAGKESTYTFDLSTASRTITIATSSSAVLITNIELMVSKTSVTISEAKYATFCYQAPLNFNGTGVTAYTAESTGTSVTLHEIEDGIVPANKGVVLYSTTAQAYDIPVATVDPSDYNSLTNELIGINARTQVNETASTKKNYIFANEEDGVGFYKASGGYLAAHKAYLSTANVTTARDFLGFDDNTTGIDVIANSKEIKSEYFNIAGQRVAQPTKGLYIVNGKKVIIK